MGEWRKAEVSYLRATRTHCELCGQPLAGRYWSAEVDGAAHAFCSEDHERKYRDYWLPRHGGGR